MELYRPTWTCGKYNPQYQIAIYYNLIEGMVYTFEDYSAEVIGKILEVPKGKSFSLDVLSDETNISTNSLIPFIDELIDLGLLSRVPITDDVVKAHRELKKRISYNSSESLKTAPQFKDYPVDMNDAELYYHENCDCISSVMLERIRPKRADLIKCGLNQVGFIVVREKFDDIMLIHIGCESIENILEPKPWIDVKVVTADHECVEDCIVFGSAIVL